MERLQQISMDEPIVIAASAVVAGGGLLYLLKKLLEKRNYVGKESVGDEYDKWADDGVLEKFWGEHIHHGYFGEDGKLKVESVKAKVTLIEKLLEFSGFNLSAQSKPIKILDVGCGIGGSSRHLASKNKNITIYGVTLSHKQVARANHLSSEMGLEDRCKFQVADALDLPFKQNEFDFVWSLESGEHMPDKKRFMSEIHRVLKPGGKVLLATWCTKNESDLNEKEKKSLRLIYDEWALPYFISIQEYENIFSKLGLKNVKSTDWSRQVAKTWPQAIWDGFWGMPWLLLRGPFVFLRTLRDVFAIVHMMRGYKQGYVLYGVLTGQK